MPRRFALIASSLAIAIVLVGCGSDDDPDDASDTTTTAEESTTTADDGEPETEESTAPEDTTEPTESTETTVAPDESTTTAGGGGGEADEEFCATYAAFDEAADELPDETVDDIKNGAQTLLEGIQAVQQVAPDELAEDLDTLVGAVQLLVDEVADATTIEEAQGAGSSVFEDEGFQAAAERVDGYFDNCPQANDDQASGG
jgi:hypothetical protein